MFIIEPYNRIWIDKYDNIKLRHKHLSSKATRKMSQNECFYIGCENKQCESITLRRRNIDLLCEEHRIKIKNKVIELMEFLNKNIDIIINEIREQYYEKLWSRTKFYRDKERDKFYEVISDKHLMYEYYKNSNMDEYFKNDPELFVFEMISIETDNQKYTFYEIPNDTLQNIFISSLQRKINDSLSELIFVNIIPIGSKTESINKDVIISKQKDKIEELQQKIDNFESKISRSHSIR